MWFNPSVADKRLTGALMLTAAGLALGACGGGPTSSVSAALEAPHFVNESAQSGIDHVYDGEFEFFVGGGVAAFDCNDDGRDELFIAGGSNPSALYRNDSPLGGQLRFVAMPSHTPRL